MVITVFNHVIFFIIWDSYQQVPAYSEIDRKFKYQYRVEGDTTTWNKSGDNQEPRGDGGKEKKVHPAPGTWTFKVGSQGKRYHQQ